MGVSEPFAQASLAPASGVARIIGVSLWHLAHYSLFCRWEQKPGVQSDIPSAPLTF
jgi:hypothetical protein